VVLAVLVLHEHVRVYRWSAVAIGFIGVLIIVSGYAEEGGGAERTLLGAVFQLIAAGVVALVVIQIRRMSVTESAVTIVVYFSSISALVALATIPFGWIVPSPMEAALLVATGILGGFAQVTLTESVRHADASLLAPFDYLALLWALVLGFLVFGNLPTVTMLAGSAIVVATGLFVIYRERQLRIASRNVSELPPVIPGN
jgi:drug/metabolite transporter (DMT)-like permease